MYKIGFCSEENEGAAVAAAPAEAPRSVAPRKSVVQVSFPGCGRTLAYYNDKFDLRVGDMVYVDGKLEGTRGHEYYAENHVVYLCVDGTHGFAIVRGTESYEVEFEFCDGMYPG